MDDILLNKAAVAERCIRRIKEEYAADPSLGNYSHLDALILNIERACQTSIDSAMHICAEQHLGIPQSSADAFMLLEKKGLITKELSLNLRQMTTFRNIAVHEYQILDLTIVEEIALTRYSDFTEFFSALGVSIKP